MMEWVREKAAENGVSVSHVVSCAVAEAILKEE